VERLTLHHLALRVADCERAAAFYAGVLGLRELRRVHDGAALRSIWLRAGEAVLMLEHALRGQGPDSGSGHLLALSVDSLGEWETRLGSAGVPIDDRTPYTLYVRDPDGHRVGLTVYENPD
jgi:catechol 2,3-dioxygenase-like lactoylglutathione lyase family enzyme